MSEKETKQTEIKDTKEERVTKTKKIDKTVENQVDDFKNITELTEDEIKKLPRISVILKKSENKKNKNVYYSLLIRFNDLLKINYSKLSETRYNLIKLKLGLDLKISEDTLRVPVRLVKGLRKDDSEYHQIELILGKDLYETDIWFSKDELELLELTMPKVTFSVRPERIENLDLDLSD